jgi:hypothetical protein
VNPDEFVTREAFDRLSNDEAQTYVDSFLGSFGAVIRDDDSEAEQKLAYLEHYFDLAEWILPADEYEEAVRAAISADAITNSNTLRVC